MRINRLVESRSELWEEPLLLILSFLTTLTLVPFLQLPFKNPYNISNVYNATGHNPDNNYWAFIIAIIGSLFLFYFLRKIYYGKFRWIIKLLVIGLVIINYFIVQMLSSATVYPIDNFHMGEQLSPGNAFYTGENLYSDAFYLRGGGLDAVIPAVSFLIFGHTMGSLLIFWHILMLLSLAGFLGLLAALVRNPLAFAGAIALFYFSDATIFTDPRDLPVWVVIGMVLLLFKAGLSVRNRRIILISIGIVSGLSLYLSVDRGTLLLAFSFLIAAFHLVFTPDRSGNFKLSLRTWKSNLLYSLLVLGGLLAGLTVPIALIGISSFVSFIKMSFLEIPSYAGLLVAQPYPGIFGSTNIFWAPVFIAVSTGFLLIKLYGLSALKNKNFLFALSLLFIFGILYLKIGVNRIHPLKLASSTAPLYLAAFLTVCYAAKLSFENKKVAFSLFAPVILTVVLMIYFYQPKTSYFANASFPTRAQFAAYKNMLGKSDDSWISDETRQVREYIENNTTPDDAIYAFTSDPIYYYLANRDNPTRFYISWYADPQPYTNELLSDLMNDKPKIIIYSENTWMDAPDNVSMKDRLPEVEKWLKDNYKSSIKIGQTTLLLP